MKKYIDSAQPASDAYDVAAAIGPVEDGQGVSRVVQRTGSQTYTIASFFQYYLITSWKMKSVLILSAGKQGYSAAPPIDGNRSASHDPTVPCLRRTRCLAGMSTCHRSSRSISEFCSSQPQENMSLHLRTASSGPYEQVSLLPPCISSSLSCIGCARCRKHVPPFIVSVSDTLTFIRKARRGGGTWTPSSLRQSTY